MIISKTFSAAGVSEPIYVRSGEDFDYATTAAGGFAELVYLESSNNGGQTWDVIVSDIASTIASTRVRNYDAKPQLYRFRCKQVGGVFTGTLAITLSDVVEDVAGSEFVNGSGVVVGAVTEDGIRADKVSATTLAVSGNSTLTGNLAVSGDLAKTKIAGVRVSNASGYEDFLKVSGDITGLAAGAKTYGINVEMTRPITSDTTGGDIDDAGLKIRIRNEADGNTAGNTLRGIDIQARNHDAGATITNLNGGVVSVQTDSGGTTESAVALNAQTTLNGTVTTTHLGLDVRTFRQSAGVPTLEAIARLRNGNTSGTGVATGLLITSEGGAPSSILNAIDLSGALITGADVVLGNGCFIYSGTAVTRAAVRADIGNSAPIGSMYISTGAVGTTKPNTYIKVANAAADTDWERLVTQASD